MPQNPFSNVLRVPGREQDPLPPPITVDLPEESGISFENGASKTELPDGSVVIDLEPRKDGKPKSDKFSANLAEEMDEPELNKIASELLEGIDRDNQSRQDHLTMISEGIKLLGLIVESNTASAAQSAAPLEGMSTVRHPLLIEACQNFQAPTGLP